MFFSNVQFLKELQKQTRKQSKLLHRIILLSRILAFIFIVLAFAQPLFNRKEQSVVSKKGQIAAFFIDNSFSMEAEGSKGTLLDEAKEKTREALSAYGQDDRFQLLTNDFEGKHQRLVSKDEFVTMLQEIKPTATMRSLKEIINRESDLLTPYGKHNAVFHVISDFQKSTLLSAVPDSGLNKGYLIQLAPANARNLFIDSCWFSNPVLQINQSAVLTVKVSNVSDTDLEKIPVRLIIEGAQRAVASVDVPAGASGEIIFTFTNNKPGRFSGFIEIDDYPVTYDDVYYFTYNISPEISVLCINETESDPYINSVYSIDSVVRLNNTTSRQIDISAIKTYKVVILNRLSSYSSGLVTEIKKFVVNGGSLVIIPPDKADITAQNALLTPMGTGVFRDINTAAAKVDNIKTAHALYAEVFEQGSLKEENTDMPKINMHYTIAENQGIFTETLLELQNGAPLLNFYKLDAGKIYLFSAPLTDQGGNFVRHALYVPTMLNIAFQSEQLSPLMYYLNTENPIPVSGSFPSADRVVSLKQADRAFELIPERRQINGRNMIFLNGQLSQSGIYHLVSEKEVIESYAFNYDRKESDITAATPVELNEAAQTTGFSVIERSEKPLSAMIDDNKNNNKYWQWFLLAALAALIAEAVLLALPLFVSNNRDRGRV